MYILIHGPAQKKHRLDNQGIYIYKFGKSVVRRVLPYAYDDGRWVSFLLEYVANKSYAFFHGHLKSVKYIYAHAQNIFVI